jgi:sugar lactone lactonase YvrE
VRRIAIATREVTTVAGGGTQGSIDGTGSAARFHYPVAVAADGAGALYVADYGENVYPYPKGGKIRRIDLATGAVSTLAGSGLYASIDGQGAVAAFNTPDALTVDAAGNVYVAEQNGSRIRRVTPRGLVTTIAGSGALSSTDGIGTGASFHQPWGIAVTPDGRVLYVADMATHKIRKLAQLP